jgi:hypothetical protein
VQEGIFTRYRRLLSGEIGIMLTVMEPLKHKSGSVGCGLMTSPTKAVEQTGPRRRGSLFGDFKYQLAQVLERQGLTPTEYSRRVGHSNAGLIFLVLKGDRGVPLDELHRWLAPLEVTDEEYGGLYLAALRDYAPRYVLDIINRAEGILQEMASAVIADRQSRGLPTDPFPTLSASLGQRPSQAAGSPDSGRAKS